MDLISKISDYESGDMSDTDIVEFFQHLVNTGIAWSLQGHYGRAAMHLIEQGVVHAPHTKEQSYPDFEQSYILEETE